MKLSNLLATIAVLLICSSLQAQDTLAQYSSPQLDSIYKTKKKPQEQLPYAIAMLQKGEKELDTQDTAYAKLLYKLGDTYQKLRDFPTATTYLQQAIDIQKIKAPKQTDYAHSLHNLASLYKDIGDYTKAEPFYLQSLAIYKETVGEKHSYYANCLNNLGNLYLGMGDYVKTEACHQQALAIRKEIFGEKHPQYAASLGNLAILNQKIGNYPKAETFYLEALAIQKEILGEKHPQYAGSLVNLGNLYAKMGDYTKSEALHLQAFALQKEIQGTKHPHYAATLNNLAALYYTIEDYPKAASFYLEGLAIQKEVLGEKHPDYAGSLHNLGLLYKNMGDYTKSESFYTQALSIQKEVLGEKHKLYASSVNNLGILYDVMRNYTKAQAYFALLLPLYFEYLEKTGATLGEKAKQDLFKTIDSDINNINAFAAFHRQHDSLLVLVQNGLLFTKGYALAGVTELLPFVKSLKDTSLINIYNAWNTTKYQLGKAYGMSLAEQIKKGIKLDSLEQLANDQEAAIMRASVVLKKRLGYDKKRFYYKDLVTNIGKDEVAIDFVRFEDENADTAWYYAMITQQGWEFPKFIPLCLESQLTPYASAEVHPEKESYITKPEWNGDLYSLVIKPLEPYLKNKKTIHWSPVGLMNQVALGTLKNSKNKMLAERFEVHQYGALKDFIFKRQNDGSTGSIDKNVLLVGDIAFDLEEAEHINLAENTKDADLYASRSIPTDSTRGSNRFVPLKGTKVEIENLNKAFSSNKWTIEKLQQKDALEEKVREYSGDKTPSVLHFATHGFFIPAKKEGYDNPLLRSGIALAGANRVWMGKPALEGVEDGLWTAYEIANTNLMQADLVVLSACETAKGQIDPHEGVLGLQRSFKIAGVENMLLSLWQVPDKETVELMEEFYKYYLKGVVPSEALRKAQGVMRKKYPEPYYWAAFILIE